MLSTRNRFYTFLLVACAVGFAWLALHFVQNVNTQMQFCLIKATTGFPCPACGTTRAVAALIRGQWVEGIALNPFGVPVLLIMVVAPLWVVVDVLRATDSLFRTFRALEGKLSSWGIALPLLGLVLANWIWNYYKGY